MIYLVLIVTHVGVENALADALDGVTQPRRVYVAGVEETDALAASLDGQSIDACNELTAEEMRRFKYTEFIGSEHTMQSETVFQGYVALAADRVVQLQRKYPSPMARYAA